MLTPDRRDYWAAYMTHLAQAMGLGHMVWEVKLKPCSDDDFAKVRFRPYQHVAVVKLRESFEDMAPEAQQDTLVHEILHAKYLGLDQAVENVMSVTPPGVPKDVWRTTHERLEAAILAAEEYAVSDETKAWCKVLPLPPEVEDGEA